MEPRKFEARPASRISNHEADIYGKHIVQLFKDKQITSIQPIDILEDAKDENTPYHKFFEWDDKKAGHEYRLYQARNLLNSIVEIRVIKHEQKQKAIKIRAFHKVKPGYTPTVTVFSNEELAKEMIHRALKEATAWSERYSIYSELAEIRQAIEATKEKLRKKLKIGKAS
jgi:hypothetical protein